MPHIGKNKKRHVIDFFLALTLCAGVFLLGRDFYYRYAVYSQSLMSEAVSDSSYYDEQYDLFSRELNLFLSAIGVPPEVVTENEDLRDWYYFELRKKTLIEDQEGFFEASVHEKIEAPVRAYLAENGIALSDEAELGFHNMLSSLEQNLSSEISHVDLIKWYEERNAYLSASEGMREILMISILLCICFLFLIQHYPLRGAFYSGIGIFSGGVLGVLYIVGKYFLSEGTGEAASSVMLYGKAVLYQGILVPLAAIAIGIFFLLLYRLLFAFRKH